MANSDDVLVLKCPHCRRKFSIPVKEARKKYKNGYVPLFCNYKCELRHGEHH